MSWLLTENQELENEYRRCLNENKIREPSLEYEKTRRRVHSTVLYMWDTTKFKIGKLKTDPSIKEHKMIDDLKNSIYEHKNSIISDLGQMTLNDGYKEWRDHEAAALSELVQQRFTQSQNPKDCKQAKIFKCYGETICGWGCQLEKYAQCLTVAYGLGRTMMFYKVPGAFYEPDEYSKYYEPITKCTDGDVTAREAKWSGSNDPQVLKGEVLRIANPPYKFLLSAFPADLLPRVEKLYRDPPLWWISQIVKFLLRRKPEVQQQLENTVKSLHVDSPIVGVHIRRTDKVGEAEFYEVNEYMELTDEYFDILNLTKKLEKRRIFLSTENMQVVDEIRKNYSHYEIIINEEALKPAVDMSKRFQSALGIMEDIYTMTQCDYLICTLTSHVSRSAIQLMQAVDIDVLDRVKSLDYRHWVVGEKAQTYRVRMNHVATDETEIDAKTGDLLTLIDNFDINGVSNVKNTRTNKQGLIPSFKLEKVVETVDFPH